MISQPDLSRQEENQLPPSPVCPAGCLLPSDSCPGPVASGDAQLDAGAGEMLQITPTSVSLAGPLSPRTRPGVSRPEAQDGRSHWICLHVPRCCHLAG